MTGVAVAYFAVGITALAVVLSCYRSEARAADRVDEARHARVLTAVRAHDAAWAGWPSGREIRSHRRPRWGRRGRARSTSEPEPVAMPEPERRGRHAMDANTSDMGQFQPAYRSRTGVARVPQVVRAQRADPQKPDPLDAALAMVPDLQEHAERHVATTATVLIPRVEPDLGGRRWPA